MKRKLKEELRKLSTDIITSRDLKEITDLYEAARSLYEKLAVLKFIDNELKDVEVDVSKNAMATKFEKMANAVLNANSSVPESNPHNEDIMTPGIDTIKDMVSEMPSETPVDEVLAEFMAKPEYVKNDKELFMPPKENGVKRETGPKSLNDKFGNTDIKVDLNNRLAFVKHLFNESTEDFNRVISQLNTIDSEERSISFITNMVKPDYNNWVGKEEYEERLIALIQRRFS
jgi:predicted MPP superfamily phosphohydrolase